MGKEIIVIDLGEKCFICRIPHNDSLCPYQEVWDKHPGKEVKKWKYRRKPGSKGIILFTGLLLSIYQAFIFTFQPGPDPVWQSVDPESKNPLIESFLFFIWFVSEVIFDIFIHTMIGIQSMINDLLIVLPREIPMPYLLLPLIFLFFVGSCFLLMIYDIGYFFYYWAYRLITHFQKS